jgi:hypothetical protein
MKTLDEFKQSGGVLDGSSGAAHEQYDGAPRPYNSKLETTMEKLGFSHGNKDGVAEPKGDRQRDSGIGGLDEGGVGRVV